MESLNQSDSKKCRICGNRFYRLPNYSYARFENAHCCSLKCMGLARLVDPMLRLHRGVIVDEHGCWNWQGGKFNTGYGRMKIEGKTRAIHRVTYEVQNGLIPEGMQIHHKCKNIACCNPAHLELVTAAEHLERTPNRFAFVNKYKMHCVRGHALTKENTYLDKRGSRYCRKCLSIRDRA